MFYPASTYPFQSAATASKFPFFYPQSLYDSFASTYMQYPFFPPPPPSPQEPVAGTETQPLGDRYQTSFGPSMFSPMQLPNFGPFRVYQFQKETQVNEESTEDQQLVENFEVLPGSEDFQPIPNLGTP